MGSSQIRHGNVHILYRFCPLCMRWRELQKAKMSSDVVMQPISEILCCFQVLYEGQSVNQVIPSNKLITNLIFMTASEFDIISLF
jgi:hypothetical protein